MTQTTDPGPAAVAVAGDRMRRARQDAGLTIVALAKRAGVSAKHLSNVERGHKRLSPPAYMRVCEALDVEPASLRADEPVRAA